MGVLMPAQSESQRKFFGSELGRERKGEPTETGLPEKKLREFATKPTGRRSVKARKQTRKRIRKPSARHI